MPNSIYLINPRENFPGYHGAEVLAAWGITSNVRVSLADLTTPTLAALVPASWTVQLCDERVEAVDIDTRAEVIGITGKVSQRNRMIELADEYRRRGKLVLIGGPYATLNPEDIRLHADILIRGEAEEIADRLFADIESGAWEAEYQGTKPDLRISPVPRWDLHRRGVALWAQVQTSRGCPFECEFCDVIQYLGRKQRWKEPEQVVRELDSLYRLGYRGVFLADDNFTIVRRRARALLEHLAEWNSARDSGRMSFSTQLSIDVTKDPGLLALCREAGMRGAFIGIETPNEASLAESMKRQNLRIDLAAEVRKVVEAGMLVTCGMIVGFDHDDVTIFERQAEFIADLPAPQISLGMLVAPAATPLHERLQGEGRLISHDRVGASDFLETNIQPKLMSVEQLKAGAKWLMNQIYAPAAFGARLQHFVSACNPPDAPARATPSVMQRALQKRLAALGPEERALVALADALAARKSPVSGEIFRALIYYCQVRYMLDLSGLWDPTLARQAPALAV